MTFADIKTANAKLKAFIDFDEGVQTHHAGPLSGLKIGIKGNIAVKGLANTAGSGARRNAIAAEDAAVVTLLRTAGASILGTLNMHEGALGATTDNVVYGRCINPWRDGFSPGGSSGGSGAAIAAGLVDAALGTDTLGSIRLPSAYCGVYGWKPGGRLLDQSGIVALAPSLDQVGPLAKDAETLWKMAAALGGPEPLRDFTGLKFAVPQDMSPASPEVQWLFDQALQKVRAAGAEILALNFDLGFSHVDMILASLLVCEIEGAKVWANELADPESEITAEFRSMLLYGSNAPDDLQAKAYETIALARAKIRKLMSDHQLAGLITPTTTHVAFDHDIGPPIDQAYNTMYANIADLPAVSAPMGLVDGLPAGIQIMSAPDRDDIALGFAGLFEPMTLPRFA